MAEKIVFFILFLLPFVVFPLGRSSFEIPKVLIAQTLIILLLILKGNTPQIQRIFFQNKLRLLLVGGILVLSLTQLVFATNPLQNFWGGGVRLQGTFCLWILMVFSLIIPVVPLKPPSPKLLLVLLFLQLIAALFIGGEINFRSVGTLGEANSLGAFAVGFWPFLYFQAKQKPIIRVIGFSLVLLIILLSGSRSGLLALALETTFIFLSSRTTLVKTTAICLLLITFSFILPFVEKTSSFENRATIWQTSFAAGMQNPLFGNGVGNLTQPLHQASARMHNDLRGEVVDSAHNFFLDWWVQGGLVGIGLFVILVFSTIRGLIRKKLHVELTILIGLFVVLSFNPVSVATLVLFWWVVGRSMLVL